MQAEIRCFEHSNSLAGRQRFSGPLERSRVSDPSWSGSGPECPEVGARAAPSFSAHACPSEQQLFAFVEGGLCAGEVGRLDVHLSACTTCTARVIQALSARTQAAVPLQDAGARCLSLDLGTCLAERYLIYRSLGLGGMGEVYEAFDLELQQPVAIKTIRARACDHPEASQRLRCEFELARRAQHPHVRRMLQFGIDDAVHTRGPQVPFMSMELIAGESLARRLRTGNLDLAGFAAMGSALLQGVAAIHQAGVIHRDIKSHNVLVRPPGSEALLAIIDFGLAIAADSDQREPPQGRSGAGSYPVEGSPAFMAPEQLAALELSFASDVFSCGVVLFQMLTGRLPFQSLRCRSSTGVRRNPREAPCRVRALAPELPASVDAFVSRCLALDASARFVDAAQALEALHDALPRR